MPYLFLERGHDRAIADLSAFIHKNPNSDKGLNQRGVSYAKKREYGRAIDDYTEAIRLDRGSDLPYSNRGSAYEKKGELDKALADFGEAQNHGSTTAPEDINRVEGAIDEAICPQSNSANALNACSRLIDAGGGGAGPYFWRAQIYLRNEDYDRAIEDLLSFYSAKAKTFWALNDRGSAYEKASWTRHWLISEKPRTTAAPQHRRA